MSSIIQDPLKALVTGPDLGEQPPSVTGLSVILAEIVHLKPLAVLFDLYRQFYGQPANLPRAEHFLFERMLNHESVIYLAYHQGKLAGFTQLYPSFSSVHLKPVWVLNDLFVHPEHRKKGVAKALIQQAQQLVRERQDYGLTLSTAHDNHPAQALYTQLGFLPDKDFLHYEWCLVN